MNDLDGIKTIEFGKRTILIDLNNDICISVNTQYMQACDMTDPDNDIIRLMERQKRIYNEHKRQNTVNTVYLFITNQCNLACEFCSIRSNKKEQLVFSELSLELLYKYIIPFINKVNPRRIIISGGEPFIHSNVLEFIEYLSKNVEAQISIQSNGLLLNNNTISKLVGKVNNIEISTAHFKNYDMLEYFINSIRKAAMDIVLSFVFDNNLQELYRILDITARYNIDLLVNFIAPTGSALDDNIEIMNSDKKIDLFKQMAKYIVQKNYLDTKLVNLFFRQIRVQKSCGGLGKALVVYPDGNVYICHSLAHKELSVGNIRTNNINTLLSNWKTLLKEKSIKEIFSVDYKKYCSDCKVKYLCGGGCGAEIYHGAILDCNFKKAMLIYNLLFYNPNNNSAENLKTFIQFCETKEYMKDIYS
ncbi:radical SAM/SPASM domain-containing protein [Lachnotalea glycerini]|uniref:Radical SAM protein n=1 Tax=Lachnotalea glycerini TaxID=1763509 RepID=A0A371JBY4_9FIRM|nr:radical SAM protein [Lachnotalea glycerini]RDY30269.1 radical SAM protein [Lachnotalea glycerini]